MDETSASWLGRVGGAASSRFGGVSFEGPGEAYGGRFGLCPVCTGHLSGHETVSSRLFHDWAQRTVAIKPYPICHFNHAPVDSALALRQEHALTPDMIDSVTILLDARQFGVVVDPIEAKRLPQSEYDAKFSVPYAVATALCQGRFSLAELEDAARLDPVVLALAHVLSAPTTTGPDTPMRSGGVKSGSQTVAS